MALWITDTADGNCRRMRRPVCRSKRMQALAVFVRCEGA
jgi:hypothetical protein